MLCRQFPGDWQIQEGEGEIFLENAQISNNALRPIRDELDHIRSGLELDEVEIKLITQGALWLMIKGDSEEIHQLLECIALRNAHLSSR